MTSVNTIELDILCFLYIHAWNILELLVASFYPEDTEFRDAEDILPSSTATKVVGVSLFFMTL